MDRLDFGFRQILASGELDLGFDQAEDAERELLVDHGLSLVDLSLTDGGILGGLVVAGVGGLDVTVSVGQARDNLGRRINTAAIATVSLANDGNVAIGGGGTAGGNSTTPGAGQERWISLFIQFERLLSDPRIDGTGATVQFRRDESFQFVITQSGDFAAPIQAGNRPAMSAGRVLLADIRRNAAGVLEIVQSGATLAASGSGNGRRQVWFRRVDSSTSPSTRAGAGFPIRGIRLEDADLRPILGQMLGYYNDHVRLDASTVDFHFAKNITYEAVAGLQWANVEAFAGQAAGAGVAGAGLGAGVQGAIIEIVNDLSATGAVSGADRLGVGAEAGVGRPAGAVGAADAIAFGTLTAGLVVLLDAVNEAVRLTGDTMTGDLLPDATVNNRALGSAGQRWDAFIETLSVDILASNVGTGGATRTIGDLAGAAGARVNLGINNADILGLLDFDGAARVTGDILPNADGTQFLGFRAISRRWVLEGADSTIDGLLGATVALTLRRATSAATTIGDLLSARGFVNEPREGVDSIGHVYAWGSRWRDEFVSSGSGGANLQSWWTSHTSGTGAAVRLNTHSGLFTASDAFRAIGFLSLLADRAAGNPAGEGVASVATFTVGRPDAATSDHRQGFYARVLGIAKNSGTARAFIGWSGDSALSTDWGNTTLPPTFIGFYLPAGGGVPWHVLIQSGGVTLADAVTPVVLSTTRYARLRLFPVTTQSLQWIVEREGVAAESGVVTLGGGDVLPAAADQLIARTDVSVADSSGEEMLVDFIEVFLV